MVQNISSVLEGYLSVSQLSRNYDKFRENQRAQGGLEGMVGGETGEDLGLVDNESPEARQAKAAEDLENHYKKEAISYIKGNLEQVLSLIPQDKQYMLIRDAVKHRDDSEMGKVFSDYSLFARFVSGPQRDQQGRVDEAGYKKVAEKVMGKLPEIIARKVEAKTGDKEKARLWAAYLAPFAETQQRYREGLIKGEFERLDGLAKSYGTADLASYLGKTFENDEEYLSFSALTYKISKNGEEEEE
jgi:hypothetical protein